MTHFYRGQRVVETATGKIWYVTAVYPRSVTVQHNRPEHGVNLPSGPTERVFKREELEEIGV